jgi:DNA-binding NtrC family response regulator
MRKVLVVDDDALVCRNLSALLSQSGYDTDQALDGVEALEKLERQTFDVVLSDILMPRMDGLALFEHIGSRWPETRIIAMTGYFQSDGASRFVAAGAHDFIGKPIMLDELLSKIERVLKAEDGVGESSFAGRAKSRQKSA